MNKKILMTILILVAVFGYNTGFAQESAIDEITKTKGAVQKTELEKIHKPDDDAFKKPPFKGEFQEFDSHHKSDLKKFHPSKSEMEKKKAEFDKRLKLTDEQKKQIEANRKSGHDKVKPIFEQKKEKMHQIKELQKNNTLTDEQKSEKIKTLKQDIHKLNEQANAYREENMKSFENILNSKQKKEFAKIKEEQKKDMEKRKAKFEKEMKKNKQNHKHPQGFPPPKPCCEEK